MGEKRQTQKKHYQKRGSKSKSSGSAVTDFLKFPIISVGLSLSGVLALSIIAAIILSGTKDPLSALVPTSIILICIASISSGFIAYKLYPASPISTGLLTGSILTLFILIIALFLKNEASPMMLSGMRVIMHIIPIPLSAIGSFLGSIKPRPKRRTPIKRR